jgi:hypothetical protein
MAGYPRWNPTMRSRTLKILLATCLALALAPQAWAQPAPGRVLLLGLFHFDNPGLDAVKYQPIDVLQPAPQAYLEQLARRLAAFAPTQVLLEYPPASDTRINEQYAQFRAGSFALRRNEIYQIGFRVAALAGLARVHGFDVQAPPGEQKLWSYLPQAPQARQQFEQLIETESRRLQQLHARLTLQDVLRQTNTAEEDRRNKGFYMLLNPVAADSGLFHGADASAHWWHRNLRMYAKVQQHAGPGERVLVIAGSGHVAILRDLLRADPLRAEEDVLPLL